jgi:hypothetical protein
MDVSITAQGRKWYGVWKNTFSDGQETSSIRSPDTYYARSLSFVGPLSLLHVIFCCSFFFVVFFLSTYADGTEISHTRVHFSRSSPKSEDQTEKNIIRPASRNRPRLHLLSSFV